MSTCRAARQRGCPGTGNRTLRGSEMGAAWRLPAALMRQPREPPLLSGGQTPGRTVTYTDPEGRTETGAPHATSPPGGGGRKEPTFLGQLLGATSGRSRLISAATCWRGGSPRDTAATTPALDLHETGVSAHPKDRRRAPQGQKVQQPAHACPHSWTTALRSPAWLSASPQTGEPRALGEGEGPPKAGAAGYRDALSLEDSCGREH